MRASDVEASITPRPSGGAVHRGDVDVPAGTRASSVGGVVIVESGGGRVGVVVASGDVEVGAASFKIVALGGADGTEGEGVVHVVAGAVAAGDEFFKLNIGGSCLSRDEGRSN